MSNADIGEAPPAAGTASPPAEVPPPKGDHIDDKPMTIWEHLEELRRRLIYSVVAFCVGCCVAWNYHDEMLNALWIPYRTAWVDTHMPGVPQLNFPGPSENFIADFRLAMIGGTALAAPVIFHQLWSFVAPGLYAREKRYIVPFVLLSTSLFVGGGYFGWRVAFPISFNYFLSLSHDAASAGVAINPAIMVGPYVDFCVQMLLAFGVLFEMPLLFLFLSIIGLVNYLHLIMYGRWFILIAFIVAAVVTPPDVPDQLAMAIPMCMLYAVSIGLTYIFGKPPSEAQRAAFRRRKKA